MTARAFNAPHASNRTGGDLASRLPVTSSRGAHLLGTPKIVLVKCPYRLCEAGRVRYLLGGRIVDNECWHCNGTGTLASNAGTVIV